MMCSLLSTINIIEMVWLTEKLLLGVDLLTGPDICHLFCGPSPTRYSMTRSIAPLSLGRMGLANGGPGGCMPEKTTHTQQLKAVQRQMP